jgi:DNA invertase Pin-like site-specific DNA recombinase
MSFKSALISLSENSTDNNEINEISEFTNFLSQLDLSNNKTKRKKSNKKEDNNCNKNTNKKKKTSNTSLCQNINNINNKVSSPNDAIIYARCSTIKQEQNNLQSLSTQVGLCLDYCIENNLNVIKIIKEIYNGHNILNLQISNVPNEFSDTNIIIADPSRMTRNVSDADIFINKCREKNIKLHFVRDKLITDTNVEYKKVMNLVCDAFIETQTMSKRLKTTCDIRKKYGSHFGQAKYGYEIRNIIDEQIKLKIRKLFTNQLEQDIIEIINRLYFGSDMINFYNIFRKVSKNENFRLLDSSNNEFDAIYYGNLNYKNIVNLLNENHIYKRNNIWTVISLSNLLSRTEDFNVKYLVLNNKNKI